MTNKMPIPAPSNPEDIVSQFQSMQQQNEMAEVLKELFDTNKTPLITDLSKDEIKLVTRIKMISELKDIPIWDTGITLFMKLMLSHQRKSRKEILEAIAGYYKQRMGLMSKIGSAFSRDGMR